MKHLTLKKENTGFVLIDVQDKLFGKVANPAEVLHKLCQAAEGFRVLELPIVVSEQYPEGLGRTIEPLKAILDPSQRVHAKTTFSCLGDEVLRDDLLNLPVENWVLAGIEAHVCVLQTAKDLLREGRGVVVLNDAISSRSIYDFSSAIAELRDCGVRISTTETVLFELLGNSTDPHFKEISNLIQQCPCGTESSSCCQL